MISLRCLCRKWSPYSKMLDSVGSWLLSKVADILHSLRSCAAFVTSSTISERPSIAMQRAAAARTLHQETYKRLNMALFTWAALSAGISIMRRSLWSAQGLM